MLSSLAMRLGPTLLVMETKRSESGSGNTFNPRDLRSYERTRLLWLVDRVTHCEWLLGGFFFRLFFTDFFKLPKLVPLVGVGFDDFLQVRIRVVAFEVEALLRGLLLLELELLLLESGVER